MLDRNFILRRSFFATEQDHWLRSDIKEKDGSFEISVDLPGVKRDQVEISLEDGLLVVEVKQRQREEREGKLLYAERSQQMNARRVFPIGKGFDEQNIKAQLEDGVLRIELPRKEPEHSKRLIDLQ